MARRHWTIMLVSDGDARIRQYRFSRELVRLVLGGALLGGALLFSIGAGAAVRGGADARVHRLARENALLREEVAKIEARSNALALQLEELSEQDRAFRLVAGLEPIHTDVLLAGIGGPGTRTVEESPLYDLAPGAAEETFETGARLESLLRRARILSSSWSEARGRLEREHGRLSATPSILPTRGYLTSGFNRRRFHPILHVARPHEGIDIAAPTGTPILAAADGVVAFAGHNGGYGLMVEIDHGHGYITRYAHASRVDVRAGQRVERGETIAAVGSTGLSIAPHLHYEVLVNGRPQNPRSFILQGAIPD